MRRIVLFIVLLTAVNCSSGKKVVRETRPADTFSIAMFKEDVLKNPKNPQSLFNLGSAFVKVDSLVLALTFLDSALQMNPDFIIAKLEKGSVLLRLNDAVAAYPLFLDVLESEDGREYATEVARRMGQPYPIYQLTSGEYNNAYGNYSPDGERISFQSDRDGNWNLYLMDSDANQELRITNSPAQDEMPVFSPTGRVIAFTSTRDDSEKVDRVNETRNIYLIEIENGTEARAVDTPADDWYPAFTNQENELVFVSEKDDPRDVEFYEKWSDIYIKDLNKGKIFRLTQNEADDGSPVVYRNGKWIVFNSNREGQFDLFRMNREGTVIEKLTSGQGNCGSPHLSHDGKYITFFNEVLGNYDIYMMHLSGEKLMRLTCDSAHDSYPRFAPDGKRILFHSDRTGKFQIYWIDVMNPLTYDEVLKVLDEKIAVLK